MSRSDSAVLLYPSVCLSGKQRLERRSRLGKALGIEQQTHQSKKILRIARFQSNCRLGVRYTLFKATTQHENQMGQGVVSRSKVGSQLDGSLQLASSQIGQDALSVSLLRSCNSISA